MGRIRLIHWNAEEARERGRLLEEAGYAVVPPKVPPGSSGTAQKEGGG